MLAGCSNDNEEPAFVPATLELTPGQGASVSISPDGASGSVTFTYQQASVTIEVATNQEQWTFSLEQPAEHFSVSRTDNSITVTVPENKTSLSFEATLTLSAGSESNFARCVLSLSQQPTPDPEVSVDPQSVRFPFSGGQTEISVSTNRQRWTIRKTVSDNFTASKVGDKVIVAAPENRIPQVKNGTLIITCGEGENTVEAEIPLSQEAAPKVSVGVDKASVQFPSEGGTETVTVTIVNAEDWSYECDNAWFTLERTGNTLTVTAPANRSANTPNAELLVFAGNKQYYNYDERTVTIKQEAWENAGAMVIELTIPEGGEEGITAILPLSDLTDCAIDWGDGTGTDRPTENLPQHVYMQAGVYQAVISGGVGHIDGGNSKFSYPYRDAPSYITAVVSWGNTDIKSMERAFYKCINLKSIPGDTDGSFSEVTTFGYAFYQTALETIPENLFTFAAKATEFRDCFDSCASLKEIPSGLFANCTSAASFYSTFRACTSLKAVPDRLFAGRSQVTKFTGLFGSCSALETIGEGVFEGCTEVQSFNQVFSYCNLKSIPAGIFDDCRKVDDFRFAFRNNTNLSGESPYTAIDGKKVHLYERNDYPEHFTPVANWGNCFNFCTGLSDYDAIVAAGWIN